MNSLYVNYLQHRRDGLAPRAAAQLTANRYGLRTPEQVTEIEQKMRRLEQRDGAAEDTPTGASPSTEEAFL